MAVNTDCISDNLDTTGVEVSTAYGSNTMTVAGVVLSDESVEITRGKISTNSISTTTMAAAAIKSRRAVRVNSSNPTRQNGSSLPEVAVKGIYGCCCRDNSDEPTTRLDDTISDSLLLVSREHYFEQFDISRVDDDRGKACKDVQAYDGGHLLGTLTSAVDYVERHQGNSIYEQDAAHMGPELCGIALDDGPLRPAWPLQGANTEHSSTSVHLTRNITLLLLPSAAMKTRFYKRKRTRKDGGIPTQRKKACKVATQPVVEESSGPKERLEAREEENKDIGSTSAVRRPYRTSKKPANPLATSGDTMPTEDELKAMTYHSIVATNGASLERGV
ncbi:hypothetical protein BASA84_001705 [Batrachochytrium salamandrivorans]|nr:hypothetical protein BASA84_001705 [Batrachochytrium salamandrivorans]